MLQHGADGRQGGGSHAGVGEGEQRQHLVQQLIQLPGCQPQGKAAQVFGNVLGDLRLTGFQGLGQLHRNFIAVVRGQHRRDGQQGGAGHPADDYIFTDLDEIGKVGGDVEHVGVVALLHLIQEVLHAHGLQNPGRGGFQIVQKDTAHGLRLVQNRPVHGGVQTQLSAQLGLEKQQGDRGLGGHVIHHVGNEGQLRTARGQGGEQTAEQPHGRSLLGFVAAGQPPGGKLDESCEIFRGDPPHGDVQSGVQQGEGGIRLHGVGVLIVEEQLVGKAGGVGVGAAAQQGVHHSLSLIADHTDLPGCQTVVRVDQLFQILRPQLKGPLFLGTGCRARRQLLFIAGVEPGQNTAHQGGGLTADVAVGHHQQFIEKLQCLLLLTGAPIGEVLLEDQHIGPDAGGVLLAPCGFQNAHEQPLPAQTVHQADVVVHGSAAQSQDHLVRGHQRRVLPGLARPAGGFQRSVNAKALQIGLKVPQLVVDVLIAQALGRVHVVQLVQNDVKGLFQGEELGDLLAILAPGLLYPEVRVHQHQGFRGQVLNLQVPDGVVGGDAADGGQSPPGEPLVCVEIVQIGDTLTGFAAEFAQVVARGGAGHQP